MAMKFLVLFFPLIAFICASPLVKSVPKKIPFNQLGQARIINGDQAALGQFPWQVALNVRSFDGGWFCGGIVLSTEWILTAGHCVPTDSLFAYIWAGVVDFGASDPAATSDEFYLHANYDPYTIENDIGVLRVYETLTFGTNIRAISLAPADVGVNVEVTISGWGLTGPSSGVSNLLNYVQLNTISNSQCEEVYGPGNVPGGMLCAISNNNPVKSPCNGDSGGPVIINVNTTNPTLVGIVSWVSDQGCLSAQPSGYTRAVYYRSWIRQITGLDV